jgi:hypothetical protein
MKKQAFILLLSLVIVASLSGCKTGSVKGKVLDVFTNKPVSNTRVQILNTPLVSTVGEDGSFEFKEVELGKHQLAAGKNKFSKALVDFELTEKSLNSDLILYVFGKKNMAPGLFEASEEGAKKIRNQWIGMDAQCEGDIVGFKLKDVIEKTGKKVTLKGPSMASQNLDLFYYQKGNNKSPITTTISPLKKVSAKKFAKKCKSIGKNNKLLVADLKEGKEFPTSYASEQMVKVAGDIGAKKSLVTFKQSGKILGSYILKGK